MLIKELKEAIAGDYHPGSGKGTWTTWNNYNYNPMFVNKSSIAYDEPVVDKEIEAQLIDQAIDILFARHPELIQDKTIRRHHLQMLIGNITSGEVNDLLTLKSFIKKLKKKGIKVEGDQPMKMKRSELKEIIRETIDAYLLNEAVPKTYKHVGDTKISLGKNFQPEGGKGKRKSGPEKFVNPGDTITIVKTMGALSRDNTNVWLTVGKDNDKVYYLTPGRWNKLRAQTNVRGGGWAEKQRVGKIRAKGDKTMAKRRAAEKKAKSAPKKRRSNKPEKGDAIMAPDKNGEIKKLDGTTAWVKWKPTGTGRAAIKGNHPVKLKDLNKTSGTVYIRGIAKPQWSYQMDQYGRGVQVEPAARSRR